MTCDPKIQQLMTKVSEKFPIIIIVGHRNQADQDKAFAEKKSKLRWPKSKHNSNPSRAVDAAPIVMKDGKETIDWNNRERLAYFGGYVMRVAEELGLKVRWGGDWNSNRDPKDDGWDMVHFELVDE
jgi:peptidoglycan L-alanyl-D-glutamate endopeptidase CwlK